ncbi:MAG: tail fiber protein [Verrucomicrobiota bacterium]
MSQPFLAEITIVGFNFAPRGYAECDGQILPIASNQALFSLLGTTYGGDGRTSFALPDLRGRTPIHEGDGYTLGQKGGEETHALTAAEIPAHTHTAKAVSDGANRDEFSGRLPATTPVAVYAPYDSTKVKNMAANLTSNVGSNQGHQNMQPYLTLLYCIAMQGTFPSRN